MSKICEWCGKEFTDSKHPNKKYCSRQCVADSMKKRVERTCCICNTRFEVAIGHTHKAIYCSTKCMGIAQRKRVPVQCKQCGKKFSVLRSASKNGRGQYCSLDCRYAAATKQIERECPICNSKFMALESSISRGCGVFCSDKCFRIHKRTSVGKICEHCGTTYLAKKSTAAGSRFCSRSCQGAWKARQNYGPTNIERAIESLLISLNIAHVSQYPIRRYTCDFYVPCANLVIEADGSYWHSLPKNMTRDRRKTRYLLDNGYRILRLPEGKINNDLDWCKQQILCAIKPGGWQSPLF